MAKKLVLRKLLINFFTFLNKYSVFDKIFSIIKNIDKFKLIEIEGNKKISFLDTNWITRFRINTFFSKEPETLNWIRNFKSGTFWDIGANIGLYSIYSSSIIKDLNVVAFEPSVLNLELLIKNINKNKKQNDILIITNPLSDLGKIDNFNFSTDEKGGANSTFGKNSNSVISYKTNSLNCKNLKDIYKINEPNYVKIDVDGNELEILRTIFQEYKNIESLLVEVSQDEEEIYSLMKQNNYKLIYEQDGKQNKIWKKIA